MNFLSEIQEPEKTPTTADHISANIANQDLKFVHKVPRDFVFSL